MRVKTTKVKNQFGVAEYMPMTDVAGCIEIGRRLLADDPTNTRAALIVGWADSLGRTPTNAEFEDFITKMLGFKLQKAERIDFEN